MRHGSVRICKSVEALLDKAHAGKLCVRNQTTHAGFGIMQLRMLSCYTATASLLR
jgi:hypothetical protein